MLAVVAADRKTVLANSRLVTDNNVRGLIRKASVLGTNNQQPYHADNQRHKPTHQSLALLELILMSLFKRSITVLPYIRIVFGN